MIELQGKQINALENLEVEKHMEWSKSQLNKMQEEVTSLNDSVSSGFLNGSIKEQIMAEILPQINNTKVIKE